MNTSNITNYKPKDFAVCQDVIIWKIIFVVLTNKLWYHNTCNMIAYINDFIEILAMSNERMS